VERQQDVGQVAPCDRLVLTQSGRAGERQCPVQSRRGSWQLFESALADPKIDGAGQLTAFVLVLPASLDRHAQQRLGGSVLARLELGPWVGRRVLGDRAQINR
jgi:hypothetical protein